MRLEYLINMQTKSLGRRNAILRLFGIALLVGLILRLNPYEFSKDAGYPIGKINGITLTGLLIADLLVLLAIGMTIVRWDTLLRAGRESIDLVQWIGVHLHIRPALACTILAYTYYCIVARDLNCNLRSPLVLISLLWPSFASGIVLSAAMRAAKGKLISGWALFVFLYVIIAVGNVVSIRNGGGQLSYDLIGWVTPKSVINFLRLNLLVVPAIVAIALWLVVLWHRRFPAISKRTGLVLVLVGLAMSVVNLSKFAVEAGSMLQSRTERTLTRVEIAPLADASDPLLLVTDQVLKKLRSPYRTVDISSYVREVRQLRGLSPAVATNPNPPKRIVVIFVESFSLNYSKKYNPSLPTSLTPELDALSGADVQPLHIRTISSPTVRGLGTHFCSVPNSDLAEQAHYNCSLLWRLRAAGWHTVMIESAPENFDLDIRRFSQIGFSEHDGSNYQLAHGNGDFVRQWGACDRVTLSTIASYIASHRDEKLFMAGLTIDTHMPEGRTDYASLTYPDAPAWIRTDRAHSLLRSAFRADYDLSNFIEALRKIDELDNTVIIITGDHSLPPIPELDDRLGLTRSRFEDIPFFIIGKKAPKAYPTSTDSQLDTAPTLAYLAGVSPDPRWWGRNLFQPVESPLPLYLYDQGRGAQYNPKTDSFDTPVGPELARLLESYPAEAAAQKDTRAAIAGAGR